MGTTGNDILTGTSAIDNLDGGKGDDTLVYILALDPTYSGIPSQMDKYDGGLGYDTLRLVMTRDEWMRSDVQADIARYLAFMAAKTSPQNEVDGVFKFSTVDLIVNHIEKLVVVVDGLVLDPRDEGIVAAADAITTTENAPSVAINLLANDSVPDLVRSVSITQPANGSVILTQNYANPAAPAAMVVYTPNAGHFDYLGAGETATETFTYTVIDADLDTATRTVTVTITGVNDGPVVLSGSFSGAVTEDAADTLSTDGSIVFSDLDLSDTHTATIASVAVSVSGNPPADFVGANGFGAISLSISENTADADPQGTLAWTFTVDNAAVQKLAAGQVATQVYTVVIDDGEGGTVSRDITVTITGTNDAPVVTSSAADAAGGVTEAGAGSAGIAGASGQLTSSDVDFGATATWSGSANGTYGAFAIGANGAWTYTLGNDRTATQALKQGQVLTETFTATVTDEHGATATQVVTITVTGTNDAPVVTSSAADAAGAVIEAGAGTSGTATASGQLTSSDVDTGATASWSGSANGTYGAFAIGANGAWTYTLGNDRTATQALKQGQVVTETFTATVTDEHGATATQVVTITVTGTNDAPVVTSSAADAAGAVIEAGAGTSGTATASGQLTSSDVDTGATASWSGSANGTYGAFSIGANGAWGYTLDNSRSATQALKQGQVVTETFAATVTDEHGATATQVVTITITGTNDAPIAVADTKAATEDTVVTGSVATNDSDVDAGATLTYSLDAPVAGLTLNTDGSYSFNAGNAAYQSLAAGQTAQVVANYTVTDEFGRSTPSALTITLTGTNDTPVFGGASTGSVTEDTTTSVSGTLTVSDADSGQSSFQAQSGLAGTYGSLNIAANGAWTYFLNNGSAAVQNLNTGQVVTDTINVRSADGTIKAVTISVNGRNEATALNGFTVSGSGMTTGNSVTLTSNGLTDAQVKTYLGMLLTPDAVAGGDATQGSAAKTTVTFATAQNLKFTFSFTGGDSGSSTYRDLGILVINGTTTKLAQFPGAVSSQTFTIALPAGTHTIGFASLDYGDTLVDATLAVTNIRSGAGTDPIVLDLNGDGFHFSGSSTVGLIAGSDEAAHAWADSNDGVLMVDLDHDGALDADTELVSETLGGFGFGSSMEALRSLDTNLDGIVDQNDAQFADVLVWRDANGDGVATSDELSSLTTHGIVGLSVKETAVNGVLDGQLVHAEGTFLKADGSTGDYVGVSFGSAVFDTGTAAASAVQFATVGDDAFVGSTAADVFAFRAMGGNDTIVGFQSGVDHIALSLSELGLANSAEVGLVTGGTAVGNGPQMIWDAASHTLLFDIDGEGGAAAIVVATMTDTTSISASDILWM